MFSSKIGAIALVAALPLAAVAAPAFAHTDSSAQVSAKVSDKTPASGQAFKVSGTFTESGNPAAAHVVRVQRKLNGTWSAVTGAKVSTTSTGTYSMRIILNSTGARDLRVVGVGQGSESNAYKPFTVTVH